MMVVVSEGDSQMDRHRWPPGRADSGTGHRPVRTANARQHGTRALTAIGYRHTGVDAFYALSWKCPSLWAICCFATTSFPEQKDFQ